MVSNNIMEVIMKEQQTLNALIQQTYDDWLVAANYLQKDYYLLAKCITNRS